MKINDDKNMGYKELRELKPGDTFEVKGIYYIKTDNTSNILRACVCLTDGCWTYLSEDTLVRSLNMEGIVYAL